MASTVEEVAAYQVFQVQAEGYAALDPMLLSEENRQISDGTKK